MHVYYVIGFVVLKVCKDGHLPRNYLSIKGTLSVLCRHYISRKSDSILVGASFLVLVFMNPFVTSETSAH